MADVERLRAVAERVEGAGNWESRPATNGDPADGPTLMLVESEVCGTIAKFGYDSSDGPLAEHIAAFDPPTVLALLDRLAAAEALHRDLASRLGFGNNITEPMAGNDTIVEWFEHQSRDASEWQESRRWRDDCYEAGHLDTEDCFEHDPALRLAAAEATVARYEHGLSWDTTCENCANLLDRCYAETVRAETAEAALARVTALAEKWDDDRAEYPTDDLGQFAAMVLRLSTAELRAALDGEGCVVTAWKSWKVPTKPRNGPLTAQECENVPVHHRTPDRLRAPHGAETWFVTPADTGATTAWDTEAQANAAAARMDPKRRVVVWVGRVAS